MQEFYEARVPKSRYGTEKWLVNGNNMDEI